MEWIKWDISHKVRRHYVSTHHGAAYANDLYVEQAPGGWIVSHDLGGEMDYDKPYVPVSARVETLDEAKELFITMSELGVGRG